MEDGTIWVLRGFEGTFDLLSPYVPHVVIIAFFVGWVLLWVWSAVEFSSRPHINETALEIMVSGQDIPASGVVSFILSLCLFALSYLFLAILESPVGYLFVVGVMGLGVVYLGVVFATWVSGIVSPTPQPETADNMPKANTTAFW